MAQKSDYKGVLVIHGGAGNIQKKYLTPEREAAYKAKLTEALQAGYDTLQNGGTSTDAVKVAINIMENSPLFNAGKGAVYTNALTNEMDASIMEGKDKNAGAVAGVKTIKNPINGAFEVMVNSPHVMLSGEGADVFAKEQGLEIVSPSYFADSTRLKQVKKIMDKEKIELDHDSEDRGEIENDDDPGKTEMGIANRKYGTVGAAALDKDGNIAAGTSTGGMTNKRWGRIGDSPVIGAGTYADNKTCAVSCTGHGEYFIRHVAAYSVSALMEYKELSLDKAANEVIFEKLYKNGGSGGLIAIDQKGNISMPFNSAGMFRGFVDEKGKITVFIYK